jgi:hypothetical protein
MTWTTPRTAVSGETITAAIFNAEIRDNFLETEVGRAFFEGNFMVAKAANSVRARSCFRDSQLQIGRTSSTTYEDLDSNADRSENFGPAVSLTCNGTAVVWFSARASNNAADSLCAYSVAVEDSTGTELVAASDAWCGMTDGIAANNDNKYGVCHRFTGLGSDLQRTFVMKYRVGSGTADFSNREMFVMAL